MAPHSSASALALPLPRQSKDVAVEGGPRLVHGGRAPATWWKPKDLLLGESGLEGGEELGLVGDRARLGVPARAVDDEIPLLLRQGLVGSDALPGHLKGLARGRDPWDGGGEEENVRGVDLEGVVLDDHLLRDPESVQALLLVGLAPHENLGALGESGALEERELWQGLDHKVVVHVSVPLDGGGQEGKVLLLRWWRRRC